LLHACYVELFKHTFQLCINFSAILSLVAVAIVLVVLATVNHTCYKVGCSLRFNGAFNTLDTLHILCYMQDGLQCPAVEFILYCSL